MLLNEMLHGIKMATITESGSSSTALSAGLRSGLLPPISRDELSDTDCNSNNNNNNGSSSSIYDHVGFSYSVWKSS